MHRILALFLAAALSTGVLAGDKPAKATKASAVAGAGEPSLKSAGVMVLDPTTGQTLYSKNADEVTPHVVNRIPYAPAVVFLPFG